MNNEVVIRSAAERDLDEALACDSNLRHNPLRRMSLARHVALGQCWIAERETRVTGLLVLEYTFYENGFVSLLVVHPDFRRQNIGRALLEHALSVCSTPKLFTSTNESNSPMRALLATLGFEPSGVIYNLDAGDSELVFFHRSCR